MKWREYVFVCLKGTSHGDVSFKHAEHTIWRKGRVFLFCFGVFLAEVCFKRLIASVSMGNNECIR